MLLFGVHRNVTDSDILALERRLLQTMDMIVSKKKRWVINRRLERIKFNIMSLYEKSVSWGFSLNNTCTEFLADALICVELPWPGGRCTSEEKTKTNRPESGGCSRASLLLLRALRVSFVIVSAFDTHLATFRVFKCCALFCPQAWGS